MESNGADGGGDEELAAPAGTTGGTGVGFFCSASVLATAAGAGARFSSGATVVVAGLSITGAGGADSGRRFAEAAIVERLAGDFFCDRFGFMAKRS